ncbi:MAG: 1-deoxy-D-xylulose-5-phosphate synthase [Endomicrobiia bacterium]
MNNLEEKNSLLEKINFPQDLRNLRLDQLSIVAEEIREMIINTVSETGGHLGASLGAVELTLVLHYIFNTPVDKIVWDVGHQAYAHKIISGRKNKFSTLRKFGGISGFPNRNESEYDTFTVGHASTAVSAALGMAIARDLKGEDYKVVAVLGDGSLTGGMTYEALNNAGHLNTNIIVILNDNAMFISQRVGAIAKMLVRILTLGLIKRIESKIEQFFRRLHFVGAYFLRVAKRFKLLFFPGMLFEEMGFAYIGPVDGHDIKELYDVIKNTKDFNGPVLIHVITKKGKGYPYAENNPTKFHGIGKFDKETGVCVEKSGSLSFTKVFGETITKLAQENDKIVAITAAMTDGCGFEKFAQMYPKKFFDVGIAEEHAVTFCAGLATEGFIPVCAIYSTFLQRSFDQIIHDIALPNLHVIFAIDRAGLVGEDGATHHGSFDLSYLRLIPNIKILIPKDGEELKNMLYSALEFSGPVAIRYPRNVIPDSETFSLEKLKKIPLGKSEVIEEIDNAEVVILASGPYVYEAQKIAKFLSAKIGVINVRFLKPLDEDLLRSIKSQKIVTIEENTVIGGLYGAVCEFYNKEKINKQILSISLPDSFVTHGEIKLLRQHLGLDTDSIIKKMESFFDL